MAADIVANPNNINTDHSGDNAYGVNETVNDAENGVVDIQTGGKIDRAWGGYSSDGIAKTNQASLSGGEAISVTGGGSRNNDADNNQVSISAGTVAHEVTGGRSLEKDATNNRVSITGGQMRGVRGGISTGGVGSAKDNQVSITGGEVSLDISGGVSNNGDATNNYVSIDGGTVERYVYGGKAEHHANYNQVSISDGTIKLKVTGGYSSAQNADNNQITISGGTVERSVIGGDSTKGVAKDNQVTMSAGTVESVIGGNSREGVATNNHVSITGGTVENGVIGGSSNKGTATNNHVSISGGTFSGNIRAGRGIETASTVTDNTLTIEGGSFKETVRLSGYGYYDQAATTGGNSMHLKIAGLNIDNISRFNNLYFYLPNSVNNGDNVVTLQASSTDLSAAAFGVCAAAFGVCAAVGSPLTVGDTVTLIQAQNLSTSSDTPPNTTAGMTGCSPDYEFTLQKVNNALIATVTKAPGGINTYSIGGTVSGLSGTLVLQNNGGDDLTLTADGGFTFATPVANGGSYAVSVFANPAGQTCSVNNASGTVNGGPVTGVSVTCQATSAPQQGTAQPVPGLGGKALALLMLILAAITAWFIHRRSATVL